MIIRVVIWVMISWHIEQRNVQDGQQVLEVGVWQIAAPQDQLDILEMSIRTQAVEPLDHLIADRKDFHSDVLCRINSFPAREFIRNRGLCRSVHRRFTACQSAFPPSLYEIEMLITFG